jgi:ABC-type multidrug transport system fused ATPase/permease subunit
VGRQAREFWQALRNTPEAFRLVWSASRHAALAGIGLMLVAAVLPAGQAWVGKLIIDAIVNATNLHMEPIVGLRYVVPYLALEFALILIGSLTGQVRSLFDRIIQSQLRTFAMTIGISTPRAN